MIVAETTARPCTPTAGRGRATDQCYTAAHTPPPAAQARSTAACPLLRETRQLCPRWRPSAGPWVAGPDPGISSRVFSQQLTVSPRELQPLSLATSWKEQSAQDGSPTGWRRRAREEAIGVLFPKETMWLSPRDLNVFLAGRHLSKQTKSVTPSWLLLLRQPSLQPPGQP